MQSNPLISIVVPVYRVESYLAQCVGSLRAQSYSNIEIICVNDGSPDRCELLLDMFDELDPRITVITQENKGLPAARNAGLTVATGDIVMFVDSDDYLEPNACKVVAQAFLDNDPLDALVFGTNIISSDREHDEWLEDTLTTPDKVYDEFDLSIIFEEPSNPFVWRNAFSMEFLKSNDLKFEEDIKYGEDKVFQLVAFPRAKKTAFISDKIYNYRCSRKESLMTVTGKELVDRYRKHVMIADRICQRWTEHGEMQKYAGPLFSWTLDFMGYDFLKEDPEDQAELCRLLREMWKKWFPTDIAQTSNLNKYDMQRYEWIIKDLSPQERAHVQKAIEVNAEKLEYLPQGAIGSVKRIVKKPLRKVLHALRYVVWSPAAHGSQHFDEMHERIDRLEMQNINTTENLLLMLEMRKKNN